MEVSVVTGASSGIGRALCLAIAHAKGRAGTQPAPRRVVLAVARREEELQLLAQQVAEAGDANSGGSVVVPVAADITTQQGCDTVCDAVQRALRTEAAPEIGVQSYASHVVHCAGILENVGQSCLEIAPSDLR
jgi:NAD(P)-dependent dehydrogenase (short-subunit alcohol dehydrogenase family)